MPKKGKKNNVKKNKSKKIIKEQITNEFLLFAFLLSTISVLAIALNSYKFNIFNTNITFSVIILPIIVFVNNYITKKFGFKDSLRSIIISTLVIVAFSILISDLIGSQVDVITLFGQVVAYSVSLVINLSIYYYVISNMEIKKESALIYLSYIFTMMINQLLYLLFDKNMALTDQFFKECIISIIIEAIISIILVYFDNKIKRGIEE